MGGTTLKIKSDAFQSPLGEVVKETRGNLPVSKMKLGFQSPLGEVVKETV